jgi:uncharacterized repeat protein (TIGR03809 family)
MDYHIGTLRTEEIARKWMMLAERRRDHLDELHRTGRWRKYFSEEKLLSLKRATERTIQEWQALAGPGVAELPRGPEIAADAPIASMHPAEDVEAGEGPAEHIHA